MNVYVRFIMSKVSIDPEKAMLVNTTSRSTTWTRGLSPFLCGPVDLYGGNKALNVENAWQACKVYQKHVDENNNPTEEYFKWAKLIWADSYAHRYPMGKGAKPLYSWWDGEKLDYINARKKIYAPLYAKAVEGTDSYKRLKEEFEKKDLYLLDFDAYDHKSKGMSYVDVLNKPDKKMGHAFVLAMMLEDQRVWE